MELLSGTQLYAFGRILIQSVDCLKININCSYLFIGIIAFLRAKSPDFVTFV